MARVIPDHDLHEYRILCDHCKKIIGYYVPEVKIQLVNYSLSKQNDKLRYIICPNCNNTILFL